MGKVSGSRGGKWNQKEKSETVYLFATDCFKLNY